MNVYEGWKVYGPYTRKDGRKHVCLTRKMGDATERKTVSYPKFLLEIDLNRYLTEDETVDHLDRNFTNDNLGNLEVRQRSSHSSIDAKRVKSMQFICECCGCEFHAEGKKLNDIANNRAKGCKGPFCSKKCAGVAAHDIEAYSVAEVNREHYYILK